MSPPPDNSVVGVISLSAAFSIAPSLSSDVSSFGGGTWLKKEPDTGSSPFSLSLLSSLDMARGNVRDDGDVCTKNDGSRRELEVIKAPSAFNCIGSMQQTDKNIARAMIPLILWR